MRWNENETYQFVKIYFEHEHLWNTRHVANKSNERRLKAYKEVIAKFETATGIQLTLNEVRIKVKNLKSTYSQELSKIRQRSGPDFTYKPAIKWFAVWHKYMQSARRSTKNSSEDQSNSADPDSQRLWASVDSSDEPEIDPFEMQYNNDFVYIMKPELNKTQLKQEADVMFENRRTDTPDGNVRGSLDSNFDLVKEDEFDIYGKYIASQLRSMDLQRALTLQLEIQNLVSEARLADLSNHCSNSRQIT